MDGRIGAACRKAGLVYTRYVDDLTISGSFDLTQSGFQKVVTEILREHGFTVNPSKSQCEPISKETSITNVRIVRGKLDVRKEYIEELERQLDDARRLANGQHFDGPYYTEGQIRGRVQLVCWGNPGRRSRLMAKFRSISCRRVAEAAQEQGLVAQKNTLHRATDFAPSSQEARR
ncbi:MAG: hypothetical protein ACQESR_12795 [Planctomycetota bacterium]